MTAEASTTEAQSTVRHVPPKAPRRPVRPDFTARDELLKKIQAKIAEYQAAAKSKSAQIDAYMNEGRSSNRLEELKRALANSVHLREQLQKQRDVTQKRLKELSAVPSVKAPVKSGVDANLSAESVHAAMEKLHKKVIAEVDHTERERLIARLEALRASYEQLNRPDAASGAVSGAALKAKLGTELEAQVSELRRVQAQEAQERADLDGLRAQLSTSQPDIERLKTEREQCYEVVRKLRAECDNINDDYQQQFEQYKADRATWDAHHKERQAERLAERKQRDEERAKQDAESRGPPFSIEMMRCDQLLLWCKQYTAREQLAASADAAAPAPDAFAGMTASRAKRSDADEDIFATSTSRTKGKKKASRRGGAATGEKRPEAQKVHLDMDSLALLSQLRLPVPSTAADIPDLARSVQSKRTEFEELQKRKLAGEELTEMGDEGEAGPSTEGGGAPAAASTVRVSLRCDEAFGSVLVELKAC